MRPEESGGSGCRPPTLAEQGCVHVDHGGGHQNAQRQVDPLQSGPGAKAWVGSTVTEDRRSTTRKPATSATAASSIDRQRRIARNGGDGSGRSAAVPRITRTPMGLLVRSDCSGLPGSANGTRPSPSARPGRQEREAPAPRTQLGEEATGRRGRPGSDAPHRRHHRRGLASTAVPAEQH